MVPFEELNGTLAMTLSKEFDCKARWSIRGAVERTAEESAAVGMAGGTRSVERDAERTVDVVNTRMPADSCGK